MSPVEDQTTRTLVAFSITVLALAFGNRILQLFWPPWLAIGVSFFVCWGPFWYLVFKNERRFPARRAWWRSVAVSALAGGTVALLTYTWDALLPLP
jgi:hypothetical protein